MSFSEKVVRSVKLSVNCPESDVNSSSQITLAPSKTHRSFSAKPRCIDHVPLRRAASLPMASGTSLTSSTSRIMMSA